MMSRFLLLLALCGLAACATTDGESEPDTDTASAQASDADAMETGTAAERATRRGTDSMAVSATRERTERRLQLERSLDQWWVAFQKQEFSRADGLSTALEQFVNKYFDEIVADLSHQNPRWRKIAASGLGFSGKNEAVAPLMRSLRDPFAEVVLGGLLSLGRLAEGGKEVAAAEITPYLGHADPDIRSNAALVLVHATKKGQGELFLPLTGAMEDTDPGVRVHVAAALGALGDADAVPFLLKGLNDRMALVRIRSAYALARIGDQRGIPGLINALDDTSVDVSKAAHKSLKRMTGQKFERRRAAWEPYWESRKSQGI